MKKIALLGSTGSIGRQALEVVKAHSDRFGVSVLTAQNSADLLIAQALASRPESVVIANKKWYGKVKAALASHPIEVYAGSEALSEAVACSSADVALTALVGYAGLKPTLAAIEAGKDIALANKETLVVAGEMVTARAREKGVRIYPVDSEHSAIYQCLVGESAKTVEKIILTASGGPFRGKKQSDLRKVSKAQALKHPNWEMGAKITVDSASLMNKGLEVIEAKWLFNLPPQSIEVVIHPQSIIHSMVQFCDGSLKAQMGLPDMKLPILYALGGGKRTPSTFERLDFLRTPALTFEAPDTEAFPNLALAFTAVEKGGNLPCALNAANEIAVHRFLKDEINFARISEINEKCLNQTPYLPKPTYEDFVQTDARAREWASEF